MLRDATELSQLSPRVWQLSRDGQQFGPYTEDELRQMGAAGELLSDDQIWREGMPGWIPAASVIPGVAPPPAVYSAPAEKVVYIQAAVPARRQRQRSAIAAGFGGTVGVIAALIVIPLVLFIGCTIIGSAKTAVSAKFDTDDAVAMAKEAVLARLKAPSTADFPTQSYDARRSPDGKWRVSGVVDAANSFNAKLRSRWVVVLHETTNNKAVVDDVEIGGS